MQRRLTLLFALLLMAYVAAYVALARAGATRGSTAIVAAATNNITQGSLQVLDPENQQLAECPLKHTDVKAEISGFLARVLVTQEFENPFKEKIEAVYTFPLPQNAAVDDMTMRVGERTIRGSIKRREEARAIYEAARASGKVAGLLDQQRPNIFAQSVANIMPGEKVKIAISYVETLKYEEGSYEFVFPMVVGPRYNPGAATGKQGGGWSPDTTRVPDASLITPPVALKGGRAGHDISIEVALNAGVPIDSVRSTLHEIDLERPSNNSAMVRLKNRSAIPNKDFALKYDVAGRRIEDALLAHQSGKGGFFTFMLQPPERVTVEDVTPKELVFVLDTSGSMSGFPIEKAKETMALALGSLYPQDTFNLITFAGDTQVLFPEPIPATRENLEKARQFLETRAGGGGTEMMKAIRAALDPSDAQNHVRIVCFMTDGYVGNDFEIVSEVQKHPNARVFSFGIGSSVNRFLLDKMAEHGRGEVEYVSLSDDGSAAARRFHERVRNPLLTDVTIDWGELKVADVYPKRIPDLFSAKPVVVTGRYAGGGRGVIKLKGKMGGRDFTREIEVDLPENESRHDVLRPLWARARIDDLMGQDYQGMQSGNARADIRETITQMGIEYRLMTQFTSFVAVEEMVITGGGEPRRIEVPVDMPEGVSHDGVFGKRGELSFDSAMPRALATAKATGAGRGGGYNTGGAARGSGVIGAIGANPPPPPTRQTTRGDRADKDRDTPVRVSREEVKRQELLSKLHPAVATLVRRLKDSSVQLSPEEAGIVRAGKAEVQVWVAAKSPELIKRLKQLGFEMLVESKSASVIIGRLPVAKIEALARLEGVRYIAPVASGRQ